MRILIALILCSCSCTPQVNAIQDNESNLNPTGVILGIECESKNISH